MRRSEEGVGGEERTKIDQRRVMLGSNREEMMKGR